MARYTIIAAIDEEGGIGKNGGIPWDYPADRKFFHYKWKIHPINDLGGGVNVEEWVK